jgi:predicted nucleic acid-binding protein
MLDTNAFDRLDADPEAASELAERRDLRLLVSEIQIAQLEAIPDEARRGRYLALADSLCARVSAASVRATPARADRHEPDRMIAAAADARCDLLVTDDEGLLSYARGAGVRAMDWKHFAGSILFRR